MWKDSKRTSMSKYEQWLGMSGDDLQEACIKLEEERDELNMELQSITFDIVAQL